MSSLKSLAAAKNRRSSNDPPPMSRPGTSIASHAAFAQQAQYQGRGGGQQRFQQEPSPPPPPSNGLPFSKLTVSDAIGLITLRLGKVEQFLIDVQQEGGGLGTNAIPNNMKLVDNSVLTSIINRLDSLEKREQNGSLDSLNRIEKELKETKEMLLNLMFKYELFTKETQTRFSEQDNKFSEQEQRFVDHENVFSEIELSLSKQTPTSIEETVLEEHEADQILSSDLKNLIKQEFLPTPNDE
jgi:plasmid maintenance system antidote protein VapI